MGLSLSTEDTTSTRVENVKKLFNVDENSTDEFIDSLNITEFNQKLPLPIIGGQQNHYLIQNNNNDVATNDVMVGGNAKDIRFISDRKRYIKYDIFNIISNLEKEEGITQRGGNKEEEKKEEQEENNISITSNDKDIEHIKNVVLKGIDNFKKNENLQSGGGQCGCEDEQRGGKKEGKKNDSSSSSSTTEDSSSDDEENNDEMGSTSNSSISAGEGLTIFPFNSSDVKSSVSERNIKMIRRKI